MNQWTSEWTGEWTSEVVKELMQQWRKGRMHQRTNEWTSEVMKELVQQWRKGRMNQWVNQWVNAGTDAPIKKGRNKALKRGPWLFQHGVVGSELAGGGDVGGLPEAVAEEADWGSGLSASLHHRHRALGSAGHAVCHVLCQCHVLWQCRVLCPCDTVCVSVTPCVLVFHRVC